MSLTHKKSPIETYSFEIVKTISIIGKFSESPKGSLARWNEHFAMAVAQFVKEKYTDEIEHEDECEKLEGWHVYLLYDEGLERHKSASWLRVTAERGPDPKTISEARYIDDRA